MAKYTPTGWTMSKEGAVKYRAHYARIDSIVQKRVRKYNLPGTDRDDLLQEGRLAAAYAVDTFAEQRGSLDRYISRVVDNALAMVAAEALAQKRQPYAWSLNVHGEWERSPLPHSPLEDAERIKCARPESSPQAPALDKERLLDRAAVRQEAMAALSALPISADAREVLRLKMLPPLELQMTARNLNAQMRIDAPSLACYLSWTLARARRAVREMRQALSTQFGAEVTL